MTSEADRLALQLAREMKTLRRELDELKRATRGRSLPFSSIETGSLKLKDGAGNIRQIVGEQPDGSFGDIKQNGPPPSAPTAATVTGAIAGLDAAWDGQLTGVTPSDLSHIDVEVSTTTGFEVRVVAGRLLGRGSLPVVPLPYQVHYVRLVAVNTSGRKSPPSTVASGTPVQVVEGDLGPGSITETQISDSAVSTPKLAATAVTAEKIAADAVIAGKIATNAVTAGTIEAGAVTAAKLAAMLVVSSTIQSPNYDPTDPDQTDGFRLDGAAGLLDARDANLSGTITGGSGTFDSATANDSLTYRGDELSETLRERNANLVAFGFLPANLYETGTNRSVVDLMQLDFDVAQDEVYTVETGFNRGRNDNDNNWSLELTYTEDGTTPQTTSTFAQKHELTTVGGAYQSAQVKFHYFANITGTVKFLLFLRSVGGGSSRIDFDAVGLLAYHTSTVRQRSSALDRYTDPSGTGGAGGGDQKQHHDTGTVTTNYSATYRGDGSLFNENDYCYQGYTTYAPANGNMRSFARIPAGATDDLIGVGTGDIVKEEIYIYYDHWHFNSGGTAIIGYYDGANQFPDIIRTSFNRGQGKWIGIQFTPIGDAIRNGNFEGIMIGPGPSTSGQYYGYARGNSQTAEVAFHCEYYK